MLKIGGFYISTTIWSGIALSSILLFTYVRILTAKIGTQIPSTTHPYLSLGIHIFILAIFILSALLPPILSEIRKNSNNTMEIPGWLGELLEVIQKLVFFPFQVLYFRIIYRLPRFFYYIEKAWSIYLINYKPKSRYFELINLIPLITIATTLLVDVLVYDQIYYFYSALGLLAIPITWHGFLLISDHALKDELNDIQRAGLLTINTSQMKVTTIITIIRG